MTSPTDTNFVDQNPTVAEIKANYTDSTVNASGLYGRPLVLNRIFNLLVLLINALQETAAVQANRLNFLSAWQKAYTDEMNQIHAFTQFNGDGSEVVDGDTIGNLNGQTIGKTIIKLTTPPGGGLPVGTLFPLSLHTYLASESSSRRIDGVSEESTKARSDMNTLNTNLTQQMQGNRQVISDDAKALQTSVNQTNDEVQQQADMATYILQTLSTLLTSIYTT